MRPDRRDKPTADADVSKVEEIKPTSIQLRGTIGDELSDGTPGEDPLCGTTYLPRKFKIGFAFPGDNCIDVYSNDIGVVPMLDGESLRGFTVLVGGGMGKNHANLDTFPRLADLRPGTHRVRAGPTRRPR